MSEVPDLGNPETMMISSSMGKLSWRRTRSSGTLEKARVRRHLARRPERASRLREAMPVAVAGSLGLGLGRGGGIGLGFLGGDLGGLALGLGGLGLGGRDAAGEPLLEANRLA